MHSRPRRRRCWRTWPGQPHPQASNSELASSPSLSCSRQLIRAFARAPWRACACHAESLLLERFVSGPHRSVPVQLRVQPPAGMATLQQVSAQACGHKSALAPVRPAVAMRQCFKAAGAPSVAQPSRGSVAARVAVRAPSRLPQQPHLVQGDASAQPSSQPQRAPQQARHRRRKRRYPRPRAFGGGLQLAAVLAGPMSLRCTGACGPRPAGDWHVQGRAARPLEAAQGLPLVRLRSLSGAAASRSQPHARSWYCGASNARRAAANACVAAQV